MPRRLTRGAALIGAALLLSGAAANADPSLAGFERVDPADVAPDPGAAPFEMLAPLYRGHPEEILTRRMLEIVAFGEDRPEGRVMLVDVILRGFLDDSVEGARWRAVFRREAALWRLTALGRQNICARGPSAGRPTRAPCP